MNQQQDCETCYKIICQQCGWKADDVSVCLIQKGEITACPECGWRPGEIL